MMEIRVLRYFLTVAREENITRAAELLHLTQPTLSRQIAQREGGYLRVSSRPGAGSTFSLFLPREEPPAVG